MACYFQFKKKTNKKNQKLFKEHECLPWPRCFVTPCSTSRGDIITPVILEFMDSQSSERVIPEPSAMYGLSTIIWAFCMQIILQILSLLLKKKKKCVHVLDYRVVFFTKFRYKHCRGSQRYPRSTQTVCQQHLKHALST